MKRIVPAVLLLSMLSGCNGPESLLQKGNLAYRRGDRAAASGYYARAQADSVYRGAAAFNLGRLFLDEGRPGEALAQFRLAERAGFASPLVGLYQGRALLESGAAAEAAERLRETTRRYPDFSEGWLALARAEASLNDLEAGLESLKRARRDPVLVEEATLLGAEWKVALGRPEEAIDDLRGLLSSHPYRIATSFALGRLLLEQERYSEAEERLRSGLEMQPTDAQGMLWLGDALRGQGRNEEARELYLGVATSGSEKHPLVVEARDRLKFLERLPSDGQGAE